MQRNETSYLTHGFMIIALFAILLAISVFVPVLGLFTLFIVPLPLAWYSARFERKQAAFVTIIAVLFSLIIGGVFGLIFGLLVAPLGFIIGDSIRTKQSKLYMFMATGLFLLLMTAVQYILSILFFNMNVLKQFITTIEVYYEQLGNIMSSFGQLPEGYDELVKQSIMLIESIMPSYYIGTVFISAWIFLIINLSLLRKLKLDVPKFPKFKEFRLPKVVLWYYLVVSIFSLFVSFEIGTFGYLVFINAALILRALLFLQGISLIHYYFDVKGWPKWSMIFATFLAVPLYMFTIIVGVLDLGFNIRGFVKDRYKK
ncbi:YybS family protein [Psychrobacillus antarcticus]|uniref:YybS family protein n=1 Tax=Psychrobacillus antarcticus TaxID=2879115 RepID=UPI0024083E69|nr:YybS family protein [Psychrobacillus antarcticus]